MAGCSAVPKAELDAYRNAFQGIHKTAQDLLLSARVEMQAHADDPLNTVPPADRRRKLEEQLEAVDARFAALEAVAQFNAVLATLARGEDPEELRSGLAGLAETITSFVGSRGAKVIAQAAPYLGTVAEAISLIGDLLRRERFREAVAAAEKPVLRILEILKADATNLHNFQGDRWLLARDAEVAKLDRLSKQFAVLVNQFAPNDALLRALEDHNAVRRSLIPPRPDWPHTPTANGQTANEANLALLASLTEQTTARVDSCNRIQVRVDAHRRLVDEFRRALVGTQQAFVILRQAGASTPRSAVASFVNDALRLRQAYLEFQEAKHR